MSIQQEYPRITPKAVEEAFGITLNNQERRLLTADHRLLSQYEQQCKGVLLMALMPVQCPACHGVICCLSAEPDWNPRAPSKDDSHVCPRCQARLEWHLGISGDQWYTLLPGQVIEIGKGPVQAHHE